MDSRAQFEKWLIDKNRSLYELAYCGDEEEDEVVCSAKATVLDMRAGWDAAWQESRAAIEVELPEKVMVEDEYDRGHNYGIQYCEEAIKAAGISIKGEGR